MERENLIEWCALLTGHSKSYYEKIPLEQLKREYEQIFDSVTQIIEEAK